MNVKTLFVRIRGRVQGPFTVEKLQELARRGQVSRMHEVSADGSIWEPASAHPEIFTRRTGAAPTSSSTRAQADTEPYKLADEMPPVEQWFHAAGADHVGPMDRAQLLAKFRSGQLPPETEVWRDGMAHWTPANQVPGLLPAQIERPIEASRTSEDKTAELGSAVIHSLAASRPWVTFIAVVGFLYGAVQLFAGICGIIIGSKRNSASTVAAGISSLVMTVLTVIGAILLLRFGACIQEVLYRKSESRLAAALDALRAFWNYAGIVLIVILALAGVLALLAVSATGGIPFGL